MLNEQKIGITRRLCDGLFENMIAIKNIRKNKIFLIFAGQPEANNFFNTRPKLIFIKYFNWEAVNQIK